jgi:hypothetical protein
VLFQPAHGASRGLAQAVLDLYLEAENGGHQLGGLERLGLWAGEKPSWFVGADLDREGPTKRAALLAQPPFLGGN